MPLFVAVIWSTCIILSAQQRVHRMNRVNWYEILGIQPHEYNRRVIKRAYKKMALKWHPDKHQNADAAEEEGQRNVHEGR